MDKIMPGEQFIPSNSDEGIDFMEEWCFFCTKDNELNGTVFNEGRKAVESDWCPIVTASYRGQAVQWRELDNGHRICTEFDPIKT